MERALVERSLTGDRAAFDDLVRSRIDIVYRTSLAILGDTADAADATQETFISAWRSRGSLRDADRFDAWFGRILVNTCRDRLRHGARRRTQDLSAELALHGGDPFRQADDRELIGSALAALSPDHQIVIVLRFYLDLSTRQIAERLGTREGTVSSRLHYALERLRTALDGPTAQEQSHD